MKIQPPLGYLLGTDRAAGRLEGLSPSGQLALQKLSEVTAQREEEDKTTAQSAQPVPTVGAHIDMRV